jgi:hypothetical protein
MPVYQISEPGLRLRWPVCCIAQTSETRRGETLAPSAPQNHQGHEQHCRRSAFYERDHLIFRGHRFPTPGDVCRVVPRLCSSPALRRGRGGADATGTSASHWTPEGDLGVRRTRAERWGKKWRPISTVVNGAGRVPERMGMPLMLWGELASLVPPRFRAQTMFLPLCSARPR